MNTLSILMPVFNIKKEWIKEAIDSFIEVYKKYKKIELLIVDDMSPDNPSKWIKEYISEHENINLIRNKKNLGRTKSIYKYVNSENKLNGQYLMILDGDDYLNYMEMVKLLKKLESMKEQEIIVTDWIFQGELKKASKKGEAISTKEVDPNLVFFNANIIYNYEKFRKTSIKFTLDRPHILWDKVLPLVIFNESKKISYLEVSPYVYREYGSSTLTDIFRIQDEYNKTLMDIFQITNFNKITKRMIEKQIWRLMTAYVFINKANPQNRKSSRVLFKEILSELQMNNELYSSFKSSSIFNNIFKFSIMSGYNPLIPIITFFMRRK